jgi:hypothetical protein
MNTLIIIDGYARIATETGLIETVRLHEGRGVRIDDRASYPQLCKGASRRGDTLTYYSPEQLARDCRAKLYKTQRGFDAAAARIVEEF